jgi:hypothetical protein
MVETDLRTRISGRFEEALRLLGAAVAMLMLLVCANLSNLLLARASAREHAMALRAALGADRKRLIRQSCSTAAHRSEPPRNRVFRTMDELVARSVFARRLVVLLLVGFAGMG